MHRTIRALGTAALLAWTFAQVSPLAQGGTMAVTVNGLPTNSGLTVTTSGPQIGSQTTTLAPANGAASLALDLGSLGKANAVMVEVQVEDCPNNQVKIVLVQQGSPVPPDDGCKRRMIGAFWWGKVTHLTIKYPNTISTGMSTTTKVLIGGGAAGVAAAVIGATAGGGSSPTGTGTGTTTTTTTSTTGTTSPGTPASTFAGTYTGTGTATTNTCGFNATAAITGTITVTDNTNGKITWTKTHTAAGVTFTFPNIQLAISSSTQASFGSSTSMTIGSAIYNASDVVHINGVTTTVTQTLTRSDGGCTVVYNITLTKTG